MQPLQNEVRLESARAAREALFWDLAEEMYVDPAVERGTMMGFPCLRVSGQFFASLEKDTGELIVKLAERRVDDRHCGRAALRTERSHIS
jgi:hypothetical protein